MGRALMYAMPNVTAEPGTKAFREQVAAKEEWLVKHIEQGYDIEDDLGIVDEKELGRSLWRQYVGESGWGSADPRNDTQQTGGFIVSQSRGLQLPQGNREGPNAFAAEKGGKEAALATGVVLEDGNGNLYWNPASEEAWKLAGVPITNAKTADTYNQAKLNFMDANPGATYADFIRAYPVGGTAGGDPNSSPPGTWNSVTGALGMPAAGNFAGGNSSGWAKNEKGGYVPVWRTGPMGGQVTPRIGIEVKDEATYQKQLAYLNKYPNGIGKNPDGSYPKELLEIDSGLTESGLQGIDQGAKPAGVIGGGRRFGRAGAPGVGGYADGGGGYGGGGDIYEGGGYVAGSSGGLVDLATTDYLKELQRQAQLDTAAQEYQFQRALGNEAGATAIENYLIDLYGGVMGVQFNPGQAPTLSYGGPPQGQPPPQVGAVTTPSPEGEIVTPGPGGVPPGLNIPTDATGQPPDTASGEALAPTGEALPEGVVAGQNIYYQKADGSVGQMTAADVEAGTFPEDFAGVLDPTTMQAAGMGGQDQQNYTPSVEGYGAQGGTPGGYTLYDAGYNPADSQTWGLLAANAGRLAQDTDAARKAIAATTTRGGQRDLALAQATLQGYGQIGGLRQGMVNQATQGLGQLMQQKKYNMQLSPASGAAAQMLGAATSKYGTDVGAATSRYGTDVGADVSRYGIDVGADTSRYTANLGAQTQRYGIDVGAATSRYGIDVGSADTRWTSQLGADTSRWTAQLGADTSRYGTDKSYDLGLKNIEAQKAMAKQQADAQKKGGFWNALGNIGGTVVRGIFGGG